MSRKIVALKWAILCCDVLRHLSNICVSKGKPSTDEATDNTRAPTNVRTFEYYSFEIFTNELFLRTNVRWRPLSIFGSHIAERSFGLARESPGCMALLLKSCADACHVPESSSEISKEAVT